jgi:small subunit ribosomal protein S8
MTDPIADMFTRIRNAQALSRKEVRMPFSKMKRELAKILEKEGYLLGYKEVKQQKGPAKDLLVELKYDSKKNPVIKKIVRVSSPGQRIYMKNDQLPKVLQGLGVAIVSTSQGLMSDHMARTRKLGGEVICKIW